MTIRIPLPAIFLMSLLTSALYAEDAPRYPRGSDPSPSLPLSHPIYRLLERYEARGAFAQPLSRIRPYTRRKAARLLLAVVESTSPGPRRTPSGEPALILSRFEIDEIDRAQAELAFELRQLTSSVGTADHPRRSRTGNPLLSEPAYAWADSNVSVALKPVLRQSLLGRSQNDETVSQTYVGAALRGTFAGRFGFRVSHYEAREWSTIPRSSREEVVARPVESVQLKGRTVDFRSAEFETIVAAPWFRIDAGKGRHLWGPGLSKSSPGTSPGVSDALFLSSNSPSYGYLRLTAEYGRVAFVHLIGFLRARSGLIDSSRTRTDNGHTRTFLRDKRLSAHRLEIRLGRRVLVGLQESVIYGDRGTEFLYTLPVSVLTAAQSYRDDTDNLMIGADATALLGSGITVHAALVMDDLKKFSPGAFSNKMGIQTGFVAVDPLGVPRTELSGEFVHLEPYLYSHNFDINTYEHFGELLGHSLGPNADAVGLGLRHWLTVAWQIRASLSRSREGENPTAPDGTLARNVGGDAFQGRRPADADRRDFLDGDVVTRVESGFSLTWAPATDLTFEVAYRTVARGNDRLAQGGRGDWRSHTWSATLDLNFR